MQKSTVISLGFIACCWILTPAQGQSSKYAPSEDKTVRSEVLFPIGQGRINLDFEENRTLLLRFTEKLNRILADTNYVVNSVVVMGTASPDGTLERNMKLAGRRAQSLAAYLLKHTKINADKIEVVNGGENWEGLRMMIEASNMPYKEKMLEIMDRYPDDRESRKHYMQYSYDSKPWLWLYKNAFPTLRMGAGGTRKRASLSILSRDNWNKMREIINSSKIDSQTRQAMLSLIDNEEDPLQRLQRIEALCPDMASFSKLQADIVEELLCEPSALSADNWTLLREQIAASEMPSRASILQVIDNNSIVNGREQQLKALDGGEPYRQILNSFFPELFTVKNASGAKNGVEDVVLCNENWSRLREMIAVSDMPNREAALALIDKQTDPVARIEQLRAMDSGNTYNYINEVFFPELLYGISPTAQHNWKQLSQMVERSELSRKGEILEIIRNNSPGPAREEAIRAMDGGESWHRMSKMLLPELLSATEQVAQNGSGMSFSYELSPAAKARAAVIAQQQTTHVTQAMPSVQNTTLTNTQTDTSQTTPERTKTTTPFIALKTDFMLWGGVMPDFKMGTWTPNLSAEVYFARSWSAQAGFAYSNWNALSGSKELYAVSVGDLEVRRWFGKPSQFNGFYLGVYGQYGEYDVQKGIEGQTGSFWSAGLGAGWLQPLSRQWALEAEIRGGYRSAQNNVYDIEQGHTYFNNKQNNGKFTPQFRLQVVYRIGKTQK